MATTRLGPGGYPVAGTGSALRNLTLQASPGTYAITGASAGLIATHILQAAPGTYAITGASALLVEGHKLLASPGIYAITGASAGLIRDHVLNASPGSYAITGASARLIEGHILKASPGTYSITGASANLVEGHKLLASPGAYSITGASAALLRGKTLQAAPGAYAITGAAANLVKGGALILQAAPGSYVITGASANLLLTRLALFGMAPLGALPIGTPPQFLFEPFVPPVVARDIDAVLTKKQLEELRKRLAKEKERKRRNFALEAETRASLRGTLESFFRDAPVEDVQEIAEQLPVKVEAPKAVQASAPLIERIDWPKLYDDRALMDRMVSDLSDIIATHARQRFEAEEDDIAMLMLMS